MTNKPLHCDYAQYAIESNAILFKKGKTFYWARFFLSQHEAQKATRLYRFCRYIDDLADEAQNKKQASTHLNKVKAELISGVSNDAVINDAIKLFYECNISVQIPIELINGVLSDLDLVRIQTEAQLLKYCYQVAGTVGIMMCKVLNVNHQNALYHAIDLGIAMQLTNICRDIYADALLDRVYLPESIVGPLKPNDIIMSDELERTKLLHAVSSLLEKADQYYASGYVGLAYLPLRSRLSILIAGKLYQQIGMKIKTNQLKSLKTKIFIPLKSKLFISMKECFKAILNRQFWWYRTVHNKQLHQYITKLPFCNG